MAGTIDDGGLSVPVNPTLKKIDYVTEFGGFIKATAVMPGVKVGVSGNLIAPQSSNQFGAEPIRTEVDAMRINGIWTPGFCVISKAGIPIKWDKRAGYGFSGATCVYTGNDLVEFDAEFTIITQTQMNAWKAFEKKFIGIMESNATTVAAQNARAAAALKAQAYQLVATARAVAANPNAPPEQKLQAQVIAQNASDAATAAASGLNPAFIATPPQPKALDVYNPILAQLGVTAIVPTNIGQWTQPEIGKWVKLIGFMQYRKARQQQGRVASATPGTTQGKPTASDAAQMEMADKLQTIENLEKALANKLPSTF